MKMLGRIRRMYLRDKVSLHEITKCTGLSRNTVRRWLRTPEEMQVPAYSRAAGFRFRKLSGFIAELEQSLKADALRPKHTRRTGRALFAHIKASGCVGGNTRVTDFIRAWRASADKDIKAFVSLRFDLGEAFQFDWSEEGMVVGGIYHRMQVSHMKLCASRGFWLVAYPSQVREMLCDAHTRSFSALGGVARRGIYNMKTAVDKIKKGKGRVVNARFTVGERPSLMEPWLLLYNEEAYPFRRKHKRSGTGLRRGQKPVHSFVNAQLSANQNTTRARNETIEEEA